MSYTQTFYHIVLRTHCSIPAIAEDHERELYSYILGFINNKEAQLYRIGGMPDHVHLFVSLPATLAMSKFVQELKSPPVNGSRRTLISRFSTDGRRSMPVFPTICATET